MDELVGAQGSSLAILSLFSRGNEGLERVPDLPAVIMLVNKAQLVLSVPGPILVSFHSTFEDLNRVVI